MPFDIASRSTVRAAVLEAPGRIRIREFPVPDVGPEDALLAIELSGVCGTDHHVYVNKIDVPMPLVLGHEIVGRVAAIGELAARRHGLEPGDRVTVEARIPCWSCEHCLTGDYRFCRTKRGYGMHLPITEPPGLWGGMSEVMYLAPGSVVHKVPVEVPLKVAAVASVFANAVQWLGHHGELATGETVVIQGAGPQGLAAALVARESGAARVIVTGLEKDAARLELAREFGADETVVTDEEDVFERIRSMTEGRLADVVLDVTGSPAAVRTSVDLVRPKGRVVLGGLSGKDTETSLRLDDLVWREIRLQGVFIKGSEAIEAANRLLAARGHEYPLERMVSHVFPLDRAEEAIAVAGGPWPDSFIKAAVAPTS